MCKQQYSTMFSCVDDPKHDLQGSIRSHATGVSEAEQAKRDSQATGRSRVKREKEEHAAKEVLCLSPAATLGCPKAEFQPCSWSGSSHRSSLPASLCPVGVVHAPLLHKICITQRTFQPRSFF